MEPDWLHPPGPIRIGISACLLGQEVRWDGTHSRDAYLTGTLGAHVEFVSVCPEVAIGLGVPRPPIRLVRSAEGGRPPGTGVTRAVGVEDPALDASDALRAYGHRVAAELHDLRGYVLKRGSPSCGMVGVKLYRPGGRVPALRGVGLFAEALRAARPELPMEEEGRLGDPALRDGFLECVFALHRWCALHAGGLGPATALTAARLAEFHRRHRLALRARGRAAARAVDALAAQAAEPGAARRGLIGAALATAYVRAFMAALRRPPTRRGHAEVLRHVLGLLRPQLDPAHHAELAGQIEGYRTGQVPRALPLTLLRHHLRHHPHPEASGQTYLEPSPAEALLRFGG